MTPHAFFPSLFFLASTLGTHLTPIEDMLSASADVTAVAQQEEPLFPVVDCDEPAARLATARLMLAWSWKETGWRNIAVGLPGTPDRYVGPGMVSPFWFAKVPGAFTEDKVLWSRREGFRLMHHVMFFLRGHCKGLRAGLGAYAGRECGDAQDLVGWRCTLAGVDCGAKGAK